MKIVSFVIFVLTINPLFGLPKVANKSYANKVILELEDPSIGESLTMEILSYSQGVSMPFNAVSQEPTFQPNFNDFKISRFVDLYTSYFYQKCILGERIPLVKLSYYKALNNGNSSYEYMKIQLTNVLVTSVSIGGGTDNPIQTISFAFRQFDLFISKPSTTQSKGFETKTFSFDLSANH